MLRNTLIALSLLLSCSSFADEIVVKPLKDGHVLVETPGYSFEVPKGWTVGKETPWGARDINSKDRAGSFGAMTADATTATWDSLYRVSLGFIMREERGTATEYRKFKTAKGYEAIAFEVANKEGFVSRRYVLLKNNDGRALALSVKIDSKANEEMMVKSFDRMVKTASFR